MTEESIERTYTKSEVDMAVGEALRRVQRELELWGEGQCVDHVRHVADVLGVTIPDE